MNVQTLLIPEIIWVFGIIVMVLISKGHKERKTWIVLSIFLGLIVTIIFWLTQMRSKTNNNTQ